VSESAVVVVRGSGGGGSVCAARTGTQRARGVVIVKVLVME